MNNTLSKVLAFAAGAAAGSVVTWKLVRIKYEQIAQEEIESVREMYSRRDSANTEEEKASEDDDEDPEYDEEQYEEIIKSASYTENVEEEAEDGMSVPYVIEPQEFDENDYNTVTLYCYEDGVIENALTKEILDEDEIEECIGRDSLTHFGEYEDDSVFIRNDDMETDFEILKVNERYSEDD